jgi:hypothetical protein
MLFHLARMADAGDFHRTGAKEGEWLFLTAGGRWSMNVERSICFLTHDAADTYHRHLPWKTRDRCAVISTEGHYA